MQKTIKSFRVAMDEELLKKYEEVKKFLGLEADAEVIRFLINQFHRTYIQKKKDLDDVLDDMVVYKEEGEIR